MVEPSFSSVVSACQPISGPDILARNVNLWLRQVVY